MNIYDCLNKLSNCLSLNGILKNITYKKINKMNILILNKLDEELEKILIDSENCEEDYDINLSNFDLYSDNIKLNKIEIEFQIKQTNQVIEKIQAKLCEEKNNKIYDYKNIETLENSLDFYKDILLKLNASKVQLNKKETDLNLLCSNSKNNIKLNKKLNNNDLLIDKINLIKKLIGTISTKEQYIFFDLPNEIIELETQKTSVIKNRFKLIYEFINIKKSENNELNKLYITLKEELNKLTKKIQNDSNYLKSLTKLNHNNEKRTEIENNMLENSLQIKTFENYIKSIENYIKRFESKKQNIEIKINKIKEKNKKYWEIKNIDSDISREIKKNNKEIKEKEEDIQKINKIILSYENTIFDLKRNKRSLEIFYGNEEKKLKELDENYKSIDKEKYLDDKNKIIIIKNILIILKIHIEYLNGEYLNMIKDIINSTDEVYIVKWFNVSEKIKNSIDIDKINNNIIEYFS